MSQNVFSLFLSLLANFILKLVVIHVDQFQSRIQNVTVVILLSLSTHTKMLVCVSSINVRYAMHWMSIEIILQSIRFCTFGLPSLFAIGWIAGLFPNDMPWGSNTHTQKKKKLKWTQTQFKSHMELYTIKLLDIVWNSWRIKYVHINF